MKKSSYSPKVLELIAKEVGGHFTGDEIVKMLTGFGMAREIIQYPNTKWWTINEAFKYIKANYETPDDSISKLVMDFLHPLNHNLNEEKAERLANQIEKFLKYDNFYIRDTGTEYLVFSNEEMEEMHSFSPTEIAQQKVKSEDTKKLDEQKIKDSKDTIKKLRENHQAYMDVIEIFCQNSKKPTKELNDAYLFLSKKIATAINQLDLQYNRITFYRPFKNDLYTAEIEWNGTGAFGEIILGPRLSWDAVRPYLHRVHSEISKVFNLSEEDNQMTDDEKRLEEITSLISEKRIQKTLIKKDEVKKMEILHKYEKGENRFYITQNEDDFKYKGKILNLSKNNDYYKVFCALYASLPEGGEIKYKELITEIKSRMPEVKSKTEAEMRKFIQANLTDKSNGFVRYADIPQTEDDGKPLIKIIHNFGVRFNNKIG